MTTYSIIENLRKNRTELHATDCGHAQPRWTHLYALGTLDAADARTAKQQYEADNEDCTITPAPCTR